VEQADQLRFEWAEPRRAGEPNPVVLDHETTEAVIALMGRAMIAVLRAVEADDER